MKACRVPAITMGLMLVAAIAGSPAPWAEAVGAHASEAARYAATIAAAKAEIEARMGAPDGPSSLALALVQPGGVLWSDAFGFLDRRSGARPTPDTRYGLASGSKVFVALATMILADRGLVDLDAPFARYVPEFRMREGEAWRDITVRMLLSHSSGLPGSDYRNGTTLVSVPGHARQVLAALADMRLKHRPGEMAVYCNDGFSLAELLVESVSGLPYAEFVRREIYAPLGMTRSALGTETLPEGSYAAMLDASGAPYPQEYINVLGTGGVYSTVNDLARLEMMFLSGGSRPDGSRLISTRALDEMGGDQSARLADNPFRLKNYGLGWDSVDEPWKPDGTVRVWAKDGGSVYFTTQLVVAPDHGLGIVVLSAGPRFDIETFSKRIIASALEERGAITAPPGTGLAARPRDAATTTAAAPAAAATFAAASGTTAAAAIPAPAKSGSIAGHYIGRAINRLAETPEGLEMALSYMEQWIPTMSGIKEAKGGLWESAAAPGRAWFAFDHAGRSYLAERNGDPKALGGSLSIIGMKLPPITEPLPAAWKARLGRRWLLTNDPFGAFQAIGMSPPGFSLREDPGLPGYLVASPWSSEEKALDPRLGDARAGMVGHLAGRDLNDLVVVAIDGEEWLRWGSSLFRPMESVPPLGVGARTLQAAPDGRALWFRIEGAARLDVSGAESWYLYDESFALLHSQVRGRAVVGGGLSGSGSAAAGNSGASRGAAGVPAPAGSWLAVYNAPAGSVRVTLAIEAPAR